MARASAWPSSTVRTPQRARQAQLDQKTRRWRARTFWPKPSEIAARLQTVDQYIEHAPASRRQAGEADDFSVADQLVRKDETCRGRYRCRCRGTA